VEAPHAFLKSCAGHLKDNVYDQKSVTKKSLGLGDGLFWNVVPAVTREQLKEACAALEA
jgi:hypothetical protein